MSDPDRRPQHEPHVHDRVHPGGARRACSRSSMSGRHRRRMHRPRSQGASDAQDRHSAVGRRSRDRAARPRAHPRRSRSGAHRAGRGRHAERLHAAGRGAFALPGGAGDRAQHQPAGAGGARDRRRRGLDPDRLHRRDQEELVGLLRHQQARAERASAPRRWRAAARATSCGRRSTRGRTTSSSRRSGSPPSSRARRTSPRCCARKGIDTILVTGTVTNVCCKSTARDAMMCNFKTVMVSDGNAAATRRGPQRLAGGVLPDLRRRDVDRHADRLPAQQREEGPGGGGVDRLLSRTRCRTKCRHR